MEFGIHSVPLNVPNVLQHSLSLVVGRFYFSLVFCAKAENSVFNFSFVGQERDLLICKSFMTFDFFYPLEHLKRLNAVERKFLLKCLSLCVCDMQFDFRCPFGNEKNTKSLYGFGKRKNCFIEMHLIFAMQMVWKMFVFVLWGNVRLSHGKS